MTENAYLDLLKQCLTAIIYEESSNRLLTVDPSRRYRPKQLFKRAVLALAARCNWEIRKIYPFNSELRALGREWPGFCYTMVGLRRLDNLQECIESVLDRNVPGDLLEAGVWRGGAAIFMRAVLRQRGITDRTVWAADSFEGMPRPTEEPDAGYDLSKCDYLVATLADVKRNFERFGLLDRQVRFLEGWFCDTLPSAPVEKLAILRIDGDLYESTMTALDSLYDRVSPGGYVIIDDYNSWSPCRRAVDEFRRNRSITALLQDIDGRAVYWQTFCRAE